VRPRRLYGVVVRPLNFTVRRARMRTDTLVGLFLATLFFCNGAVGLVRGRVLTRLGVFVDKKASPRSFWVIEIVSFCAALFLAFLALYGHALV